MIHTKPIDAPEVATFSAALGSLIGHYMGDETLLDPQLIAAAWTAAIFPIAMLAIRFARSLWRNKPSASASTSLLLAGLMLPTIATLLTVSLVMVIGVVASGCGVNYSIVRGGWTLEDAGADGVCLTVSDDDIGDEEVARICIKEPRFLVEEDIVDKLCEGRCGN
jgi:hypothetical protein